MRISSILALLLLSAAPAFAADAVSPTLDAAVRDSGRPLVDQARDKVIKPGEALAFARIKPGDAVIDFVPGDSYYTRILSKAVGPKGNVYAYVPFTGPINAATKREQAKGAADPVDTPLAVSNLIHYRNVMVFWEFLMLDGGQFAVPKQLDAVWTYGAYHDLHTKKLDAPDMDVVSKDIFTAIKPGGYYVVSDFAAAKGTGFTQAEALGRSDEDAVKAEILKAGFLLDGESNALANPADDHTKPTSTLGDGADRFLLRFKKPANAASDQRKSADARMKVLYGNTLVTGLGLDRQRDLFFHADGTYQEFGNTGSPAQEGYWFNDPTGKRLCILHQFPSPERGYTFCLTIPDHKLGDKWDMHGRRGDETDAILKGIVYP